LKKEKKPHAFPFFFKPKWVLLLSFGTIFVNKYGAMFFLLKYDYARVPVT